MTKAGGNDRVTLSAIRALDASISSAKGSEPAARNARAHRIITRALLLASRSERGRAMKELSEVAQGRVQRLRALEALGQLEAAASHWEEAVQYFEEVKRAHRLPHTRPALDAH